MVIPCRPGAFQPPARWVGQFIVEKPTYSAQDNPNFDAMLQALGSRRAVVFGVATEYLRARRHSGSVPARIQGGCGG